MGFCFTYKPRDFYVDNAFSWTKQTKQSVSPPNINSGQKKSLYNVSCLGGVLATGKFAIAIALATTKIN